PSNPLNKRVILSRIFCREMLRLAKQAQTTRLAVKVMKGHVRVPTPVFDEQGHIKRYIRRPAIVDNAGYALFSADDTLLSGGLIPTPEPLNHHYVITNNLPENYSEQLAPIPRRQFAALLQGLHHIVGVIPSEPHTEVSVKDGVATFHGASPRGQI